MWQQAVHEAPGRRSRFRAVALGVRFADGEHARSFGEHEVERLGGARERFARKLPTRVKLRGGRRR